jgi:DNA-binding NtrC family response regulator
VSKQVRGNVAVVDDDPLMLQTWQRVLGTRHELRLFADPLAALESFSQHDVDVLVLDLQLPSMPGLQLLEHLKRLQPRAECIVVTGTGTIESAVQALKLGALDFLPKPLEDIEVALRRIQSALERKQLRDVNASLSSQLNAFTPDTELIGKSRGIAAVRDLIAQVASSPAPVLICGESGTGKELAARAVHSLSPRKDKPFVAVNCAAVAENLIDSELFGHEKGAFTGAMSAHHGLFEAAHGGTLFLDEIGDVPAATQVKLLRALQEGEVRPVGSTKSRKVDVRVVAATNVDIDAAIKAGEFREDLFYRISTFRVDMPPLRERKEDVPFIAQHLLQKAAARGGRTVSGFTDEALQALSSYRWPGNVRQLANAVEHAVTLCRGDKVEVVHLPALVMTERTAMPAPSKTDPSGVTSTPYSAARAQLIEDFDLRYLTELMRLSNGNISEASRRSGIDRANLRRMLARHQLEHLRQAT